MKGVIEMGSLFKRIIGLAALISAITAVINLMLVKKYRASSSIAVTHSAPSASILYTRTTAFVVRFVASLLKMLNLLTNCR